MSRIGFALALLLLAPPASPDGGYPLPPRAVFPQDMPRYPNLWVFVDRSLAFSYEKAVRLVTEDFRSNLELTENHGRLSNPEGCDFEATVEHLQPWRGADPALAHGHAFHIRYYNRPLEKSGRHKARWKGVEYFLVAASAHYEVEHGNPLHPDVESCPICGRTGWYANEKGSLVDRVHDPLGVELATMGKIRDERVMLLSGRPALGICNTEASFLTTDPTMKTQRIAIVILRKGWEKRKEQCVRDVD